MSESRREETEDGLPADRRRASWLGSWPEGAERRPVQCSTDFHYFPASL